MDGDRVREMEDLAEVRGHLDVHALQPEVAREIASPSLAPNLMGCWIPTMARDSEEHTKRVVMVVSEVAVGTCA